MSTDNKSLKFIHLASTASAQHSDANVGAIIFEPKSGRIAVDGAKGLEYYGGNVKNATFDDKTKILTLSFNTGNDITLDFSDTASAEGVNRVLGGLRTDVNALKLTVNGAEGVVGLVSKVATNTESISQNTLDIAANKAAIDKINSSTDGILVTAKGYTDTKISNLKGVGADDDETLKKLRDSIATLEGKHSNDGKTVAQEIDAKVGDIAGTVKDYVDSVSGNVTALTGRVTTLEKVVGSKDSGLVKDVADLAGLHADKKNESDEVVGKMTVKEEVDAGIAKVVAGAPERLDTLKEIADWIGSDTTGAAAMANDIDDLKKKVGAPADQAKADGTVYARIAKNVADISNLNSRHSGDLTVAQEVTAGIDAIGADSRTGDDGNVSVTVSTAAGSISGVTVNAGALAGKVTTNTNDISTLKTTVGSSTSGLVKDVADNKVAIANNTSAISTNTGLINANTGKITALEGLHADKSGGGKKTVAEEVTAGIDGLGVTRMASDDDGGVVVTVTTTKGKVSDVAVDASGLGTRVTTLETTVGDASKGLVNTVNTHTTDITNIKTNLGDPGADAGTGTAFARIKALETAQSSGSLTWFDWQN